FQRADGTALSAEECPLLDVIRSSRTYRNENDAFTRKDGTTFPVSYTSSPIMTDGQVVGAVLAFRDISERGRAEQALTESEQRLQAILDNSTALISLKNTQGRYILVNHWFETLFFLSKEEVVGQTDYDIFPREMADTFRVNDQKVLEAGVPLEFEEEILQVDGTHTYISNKFPVHDFAGVPYAVCAISTDITERKRVEEAQLERARLSAFNADVGTALTQSETLQESLQRCTEAFVQHLDAAFARIWTLNEEEKVLELCASAGMYTNLDGTYSRVPVGQFKIGLIAEERVPHLTNEVVGDERISDQEWARREGMVAFAGYPLIVEDRLVGVMAMFARKALTEATLEAMASVANGIALGIEHRRAEANLRASEQRYRALADAMPQLVWAADEKGAHFYYNQRWYEYTGLTEAESMGFGYASSLHPEDRERTLKRWERAWRDGEGYEMEYRIYSRPRQEYRWFLGRAVPVRDESGEITQWVGTCTDIEEQKQMEGKLEQLNREREQMIEEVSTPIVPVWQDVLVLPIIGSLDTLRMERATQTALGEVMRTGARACIIDITGARIVDSHAVANLGNLVSALRLIGAEAIVTGVSAHAAQSLVDLGLDLKGMRTHRTLAEALANIIRSPQIVRSPQRTDRRR
ncbi:MAG: PAS domain S-box protein, partial [Acidobacteria bacterium]|nr:PAS domain S-box protein [Acidobacteriota bacterium]